ncbi:hypothetical protein [Arthrobacter sp. K5]|uniref:Uncharacterized protein n=1 Tax=Arthrobacter sp. K5 TaxID=2839623 RepID=A0AAU8EW66_9MICC
MYSTGTGSSGSGANHSFAVTATGKFRMVAQVKLVASPTSGSLIVGINSDAAGAIPTAGAAGVRGFSFAQNGDILALTNPIVPGTTTPAAGNVILGTWSAGTWTVTIVGDGTTLSATLVPASGATEYYAKWAQNSSAVNNLYVFCSDSRALTGHSVRPLGARKAFASLPPSAEIEAKAARTAIWTAPHGSHNARITFPAGHDSRVPYPLVIFCHGSTGNEHSLTGTGNHQSVATALSNAGYIVASTVGTPADEWGNQSLLDAVVSVYNYIRDRWAIGPVVMWGGSMGGLGALLTVADNRIPGIAALMLNQPVCSLSYVHANGFTAGVRAAYGIAGDGSDYATKTVGHAPMLMDGTAFRGVPVWMSYSFGDTAVRPAQNGVALANKVSPTPRASPSTSAPATTRTLPCSSRPFRWTGCPGRSGTSYLMDIHSSSARDCAARSRSAVKVAAVQMTPIIRRRRRPANTRGRRLSHLRSSKMRRR